MKKRKELNALIGLAADGRRKKAKKGSGHRLLRTEPPASDSESSTEDDDEFGGLAGSHSFLCKGEYLKCCKICYPLCAFVILAACVVACVGLVWMQVALKEDLDSLKEKFRAMESNQKSSIQEIPKLNEDLLMKQKQLENIESGDMGLRKVWLNLTEMNTQISLLTSAVNHLKANIKAASDLISLPNTVEELQKSVATIGSTLNSVHGDVEKIHTAVEEQKKKTEALQNDVSNQIVKNNKEGDQFSSPSTSGAQLGNSTSNESFKQGILDLHGGLDDLNATIVEYQHHIDLRLQTFETTVDNVSQRIALLESDLPASTKLQKRDNLTIGMLENVTLTEKVIPFNQTDNDTEVEKTQTAKSMEKTAPPDSKLREKLQLINALASKPESDKQPAESKKLTKVLTTTSRPTSLPRFSPRSLGRSGDEGARLSLPGISGLDDLQDLFKKTDQGLNGRLSYEDLQKLLSFKIQESKDFKLFDADGDGKYSLSELKVALGV